MGSCGGQGPKERNMFGSLGVPELLVVLLIVLVLFGANKLPALGKGLGGAIRNFKEGMKDDTVDQQK
jgi:sec-independent protein translocase protein TatA